MRLQILTLLFFYVVYVELVQCFVETDGNNNNILIKRPKEVELDYDDFFFKNHKEEIGKEYVEDVLVETKIRDTEENKYLPDWDSLDSRPLPEWYDKAKIGIFLHWGVYCVPGFGSEWFWFNWRHEAVKQYEEFMEKNYPPGFTYQEFAPMFKAEFFDPNKFADLFVKSGAKYVVLTSKHHEGYTLFPSSRSFSWNSVDVGPHRDLVGELADAVRNAGLKFGVYHSLYEWFNPMYLEDKATNFSSQTYVFSKLWPDIKQLVNNYKPSVLWSDGDWEANDTYWNSTELLAWIYNKSPVKDEIVVNDRWGIGIPCHHGDFYNCQDRYNPGSLQNHKWENAFTLDKRSWGYKRNLNLSEILTMNQLLQEVISTVSCGGNALINIGPTKEGTIAPIFQERLLALGEWLKLNGEGIYGSSPWLHQNDTFSGNVWYTCGKTRYNAREPTAKPGKKDRVTAVYAFFLEWPQKNTLYLENITPLMKTQQWQIELLGNEGSFLKWKSGVNRTAILLPHLETVRSKHAWTLSFKLSHFS